METTHDSCLEENNCHNTFHSTISADAAFSDKVSKSWHFTSPVSSTIWIKAEYCEPGHSFNAQELMHNITLAYNDHRLSSKSVPLPYDPLSTASNSLGSLLEQLGLLYDIEDVSSIRDFLYGKEYMVNTLIETNSKIHDIFKSVVRKVKLALFNDPEEDYRGVSIGIVADITPQKALDLLQKFDDEWWLDMSAEIRKIITVDVEL